MFAGGNGIQRRYSRHSDSCCCRSDYRVTWWNNFSPVSYKVIPSLSLPAKGDANSTTKSAVAAGTIELRENPVEKTGQVNVYKRGEYDGVLLDALYPKENLSSKIQRNFFDWAAGTVSAVDDNMSFGLAQDGYQYVTGRRIDKRTTFS